MSNFAKSIFYSGTVLAVGLITIFAIYNTTEEPNQSRKGVHMSHCNQGDTNE